MLMVDLKILCYSVQFSFIFNPWTGDWRLLRNKAEECFQILLTTQMFVDKF